jgi:hypothetical protein
MRTSLVRRWAASRRQRIFPFLERRILLERRFKRLIVLTTCAAMIVMLRVVPWGRYLSAELLSSASQAGGRAIGFPKSRLQINESWRRFRELQVDETRPNVQRFYVECDASSQRLLRYAGMDPEHGLLRWGNFNWTILLSSRVFETDAEGRSYRLRPNTRSIWLVDTGMSTTSGAPKFFQVPDGPGLLEAIRGTPSRALETSRQTTNSWGLRGPEPDCAAPLRGIVLGDSFMQGVLLGDDETPPERLRRDLQIRLKTKVSILNTGVLGYSPEQYYFSLIAFADRFRPQFVVVSVASNDFGNSTEVETRGGGDWQEGKYWLEEITEYCRARRLPVLIVPVPYRGSVMGRRVPGYLGPLLKLLTVDSLAVVDPIDDFINAHLQLLTEARQQRETLTGCALFNDTVGDQHFSADGSKVWASSVGERLSLLLAKSGVSIH